MNTIKQFITDSINNKKLPILGVQIKVTNKNKTDYFHCNCFIEPSIYGLKYLKYILKNNKNPKSIECELQDFIIDANGSKIITNEADIIIFNQLKDKKVIDLYMINESNNQCLYDLDECIKNNAYKDKENINDIFLKEKIILGLYKFKHTLADFEEYIKPSTINIIDISNKYIGEIIKIACVVDEKKIVYRRSDNQKMIFLNVQDKTSRKTVGVFGKALENYETIIIEGDVAICEVKVQKRGDEFSLILKSYRTVDLDEEN